MILLSQLATLSFLLHLLSMISEFGTPKLGKNCSELKFLDLNVIVFSSHLMENQFFLDGMMVRLDLSFLNQESFYSLSMMHIIMELHLSLELMIAKKSYLVEWRVKSEYGESEDKHRLWRDLLRSIEVESLILRSMDKTLKQFPHPMMDLVSFGISSTIPE
jgi:hypothetical protein